VARAAGDPRCLTAPHLLPQVAHRMSVEVTQLISRNVIQLISRRVIQ
jgi:hypothetical protein